jgi:Zn-dependent protease
MSENEVHLPPFSLSLHFLNITRVIPVPKLDGQLHKIMQEIIPEWNGQRPGIDSECRKFLCSLVG